MRIHERKDAVVPSKRTRRKRVVATYVPKILSDEEYMQYFSGKEDGVVPRIGMNNNSKHISESWGMREG